MLLKKFGSRSLMRVAMAILLVFFASNLVARFVQPLPPFWDGWFDGLRGALLGASAALMFLYFRAVAKEQRQG
ncbi:MAG TPA: hypothetical protein VJ867_04520 [Gemmatimonadaceae bacterium]|nr:hypothetical protein [Gemmatimonadaceae bacterium]